MSDRAALLLFSQHGPAVPDFPVIVAVPHAGRDYPAALLNDAAVPPARLTQLEDRHADSIVAPAIAAGATVFIARRARAWLDLNRDPREIDSAMIAGPTSRDAVVTARSRNGLGLIPRRIGHGTELWRRKFSTAEIEYRISRHHQPYHQALANALVSARNRFGIALLIDCHSMPPIRPGHGGESPGVVIGDRFGRSAASAFTDCVEAAVRRHDVPLARNAPYAGGYSLDRHGKPQTGIHAIQIEIDRSLYLDPKLDAPGPELKRIRVLFTDVFESLVEEALAYPDAIAAE